MKAAAIIVAAGAGKRFGSKTPKQFLKLNNLPVFMWSILAFKKVKNIKQLILVVPEDKIKTLKTLEKKYKIYVVPGGAERYISVQAGLSALNPDIEYVAIHDGARPLITTDLIKKGLLSAQKNNAAVIAVQARDTIKISDNEMNVNKTIPRNNVWMAQTPQIFKCSLIKEAYKNLSIKNITDDAQVAELSGHKVAVVPGSYKNIKITDRSDMEFAKFFLKQQN